MSSEEIAKEILVAALQSGVITKPNTGVIEKNNELAIETIAKAYKTIYAAVDSVHQST